jgi:co-chaperonin GroES (HSP10)
MLKVSPANPKLLVQPMGVEIKSKSGLIMPGKVFGQDLELARIISVSTHIKDMKEDGLQPDKIVLVNTHSGFKVMYEETEMRLVTEGDIHAYVDIDGEESEVLVPETPLPADFELPDND